MSKETPVTQLSSEELGLRLGMLFEQAFKIQRDIHVITTELRQRKKDNDDVAQQR